MAREVKIILKDGTEHYGRLFMILTTGKPGKSNGKIRKTICLEVGECNEVVRIDNENIKEVISCEPVAAL